MPYNYLLKTAISKGELERRIMALEEQGKDPFGKGHVIEPALGGAAIGGVVGAALHPTRALVQRVRGGTPTRLRVGVIPATALASAALGAGSGFLAGGLGAVEEANLPFVTKIPYATSAPVVAGVGGASMGLIGVGSYQQGVRGITDLRTRGLFNTLKLLRAKPAGWRGALGTAVAGGALGVLSGLTGKELHRRFGPQSEEGLDAQ